MTNKLLLLPVLALKFKTALAIKTGLSLFSLGLGIGCLLGSSPNEGGSEVGAKTNSDESPEKKLRTRRKTAQ